MDIVLNTNFGNPNLPKVPLPGFYDDFGPDGGPISETSLGSTSKDNKPWQYFGIPWARTAQETASPKSAAAYVDALTSNGILTTTIHTPGTSGTYGLCFRFVDSANYWFFRYNTANNRFQLFAYLNGNITFDHGYVPPEPPAAGDTITVELRGDRIMGHFNEDEAFDIRNDLHLHSTLHGLWGTNNSGTQFDEVEFIPD